MGESASAEVLRAEVRVLQVADGKLTRSMYRESTKQLPRRSSHSAA
jgi:hypothetical protein